MELKLHFKDFVDLEFFLLQDEGKKNSVSPKYSEALNRKIYLEFAQTNKSPLARRDLIRYWVEQKRKIEVKDSASPGAPGEAIHESYRIVRIVLILIALTAGASLAWALLSYRGDAPINIFTYLWIIILPQLLLLTILILSLCIRRLVPSRNLTGVYPLASSLIHKIASKLNQAGKTSLPLTWQNSSSDFLGLLGRQKTIYGSILFWPIFNLFQIFGVCFNIGAICATFTKVTISDLAFGWQSTLQISPASLYQFIKLVSFPWSWCAPEAYAHPTLTQIDGSRMILKDGMAHLATADLVSWWPFLCFAVFCYGLLPRLFLLNAGMWQLRRSINRIDFTHAACDKLIQQMQSPQVSTQSRPYQRQSAASNIILTPEPADYEPLIDSGESMPAAIVYIPEDIDHQFSEDELADRILAVFKLRILGRISLTVDSAKDKEALKELMDQTDVSFASSRLIILQEAWQPPIRETISWIKNLRGVVGEKTGIIVALIGKPAHEIIFTSPQDSDLLIWEHAINGMGDPYIRVENLGG